MGSLGALQVQPCPAQSCPPCTLEPLGKGGALALSLEVPIQIPHLLLSPGVPQN